MLEIPLTLPKALEVIEELAKRFPDLIVGAGTVLDEQAAQRSIDAGARFITSPGLFPRWWPAPSGRTSCVFPGALTPSEIIAAWQAGADFVKIFPAAAEGGPRLCARAQGASAPDSAHRDRGRKPVDGVRLHSCRSARPSAWARSCCPGMLCSTARQTASMSWRADSSSW